VTASEQPMIAREAEVAVIGSGYVGTVVAAVLADLGRAVIGIEIDPHRLGVLRSGRAPFYEPGLDEILSRVVAAGRLRFTDDYDEGLAHASLAFLCVDTPPGPGGQPQTRSVEAAARGVGRAMNRPLVLVTKSTVPVGSGRWLQDTIENALGSRLPDMALSIVSNPEFLREGSAVEDFLHPDRIVLGGDAVDAVDRVAELYAPILEQSFPGGRPDRTPVLVRTSRTTAELIKYAANAFLASKISFINEMSAVCEMVGADVRDLAWAIGLDERIGTRFLQPGVGWGGSCFGKDLDALMATAREYGVEPHILDAVRRVNREQRQRVIAKLQRHIRPLRGSRVAILGLAFKPGTDDTRDAPAVSVIGELVRLGVHVTAYDPMVKEVAALPDLVTAADVATAYEGADAVVIMTEWPEFGDLDLAHMASRMRGMLVLDGRNLLDPVAVSDAGLTWEGFGRPRPKHDGGDDHNGW
jgi:UDPglucose 6-dehydrogenase